MGVGTLSMQPLRLLGLFALLLSSEVVGVAQERGGELSGRVVDATSGEGLSGGSVSVFEGERLVAGAMVRADGSYLIERLPSGDYEVVARFVGYHPERVRLRIAGEVRRDFELSVSLRSTPVEIIGSAPEVRRDAPGTVTTIAPKEMRLINPIGTQEVLGKVPGIFGAADDGIGNSRISVGIRGLNPRRSSRVLVLEDGVPIAPAPYIYPNMYYNPPAERLDRMEVIKGSAAVRYGPQTMGGVINYITERPRAEFGLHARATAGTNGFASGFLEVGGFGSATLQPQVQLLYKRGDGFRDNNGFEQANGTVKLQFLPSPTKSLYLKLNLDYENSNATYTGLTEYSFATDPTFNPKRHDNFRVLRGAADLTYTDQLSDDVIGITRGYVSLFDRDWWREKDVFVRAESYDGTSIEPVPHFESGDLIRIGNGRDNQGILRTFFTLGVEQAYTWNQELFSGASLEAGGRLHFERFIDRVKKGDSPDARDGVYYTIDPSDSSVTILGEEKAYETTALSLFAQERLHIGDLTIVPGLRLELFEQERVDRLNGAIYADRTTAVVLPGLGLNYRIGDLNLFAGVHRGFTPPSDGTLTVVSFGERRNDGGLDVEAETSWNSELGLRAGTDWLALEGALFHLFVDNMVAAYRGTAFENLGSVETYGLELATTLRGGRLSSYLPDLHLLYTLLEAHVVEATIPSAILAGEVPVDVAGRRLPYAPRHSATVGLSMELPVGFSWRLDWSYVDRMYSDLENIERIYNRGDTGPIPSHWTLDASVAYRFSDALTVDVTAKNVTDEIYIGSRLHSSPRQPEAHLSSGILPGPRRQVTLGVSWRLGRP